MKAFRIVGRLEGTSMLVLLLVAMPLKYLFALPLAVKVVGWIHGIFFMAYVSLIAKMAADHGWPFKKSVLALFSAIVPFGPFYFDWLLSKEEQARNVETSR